MHNPSLKRSAHAQIILPAISLLRRGLTVFFGAQPTKSITRTKAETRAIAGVFREKLDTQQIGRAHV